ncbi:hypothetical protein RIF29_21179 [Crotalaria pallida]|uniref:Uncharacterized protein n=1 Tax=Crotalaria pallida TaxID=3830 RepID=A0AAN9I9A0_CROPI
MLRGVSFSYTDSEKLYLDQIMAISCEDLQLLSFILQKLNGLMKADPQGLEYYCAKENFFGTKGLTQWCDPVNLRTWE